MPAVEQRFYYRWSSRARRYKRNGLMTTRENWVWSVVPTVGISVGLVEYKMTSMTMTNITANVGL